VNKRNINKLDKNIVMIKSINKRLMKAKLKHYKNIKKESKNMILISKPRCLNVWQMPPFIGKNSKLLI
jgi:predicted nucleotide-binding protein (sugar kinase/HSP70/actin superfamily)